MRPTRKSLLATVALLFAVAATSPFASGAIIGDLSITSSQEGVLVSASLIDWTPLGPPDGTFITAFGNTLTYDAGISMPIGVTGRVLDLVAGPPMVQPGFFVFPTIPGVSFALNTLGPGALSTNCAAANANGLSCSVFAGSPFVLTYDNGRTSISLTARGTATDNTPIPSVWIGSFTTQIGMTPLEIQQSFLSNPTFALRSSYSGVFTATPVPEPSTVALIGCGLVAFGIARRRRP
jgi:hypothetical protein